MLYCSDWGSNHEQFALGICLKIIFARMLSLRPNVIMIDKSWLGSNIMQYLMLLLMPHKVGLMLSVKRNKGHASFYGLLLCLLHIKKVWIDNLPPKVNVVEKNKLYQP